MKKKNYISPKINVIQLEALCNGGLSTASVIKADPKGECVGKFDVVNENVTKTDNKDLWGESNSNKWGDD